jgi:hypothetical protein
MIFKNRLDGCEKFTQNKLLEKEVLKVSFFSTNLRIILKNGKKRHLNVLETRLFKK